MKKCQCLYRITHPWIYINFVFMWMVNVSFSHLLPFIYWKVKFQDSKLDNFLIIGEGNTKETWSVAEDIILRLTFSVKNKTNDWFSLMAYQKL